MSDEMKGGRRLDYQPFENGDMGRWNGIELFGKLTKLIDDEEKLFVRFRYDGTDATTGMCFSTAQRMMSLIRDAYTTNSIIFYAVQKSNHQH